MKVKPMRDEDLDRCPRCKEDMWAGSALCETCRWEKDMDDAPGGDRAALAAPNGGDCHHETR